MIGERTLFFCDEIMKRIWVRPVPFMVMPTHDHPAERAGRIDSPGLPAKHEA